jgi:outer membrane receptor protein involved in Fe transport
MNFTTRNWYTSSVFALVLGAAGSAHAQNRPAADAATAPAPTEIVVTAEKRSSTVQDTPISITALSGEQLLNQGVSGVSGIVMAVPGLSMRTAGPGQTELEMRGLSSSGGASPTVGFYLDDYALTAPAASLAGKVVIDPDLYDLNRVEVLRGPQGTLYGSGSMGGTVKLVTNQPNLTTVQGSLDATVSTTKGGGVNGGGNVMVNLPVVQDLLAIRVVATDKYRDGWITRVVEPDFPAPTNPNGFCAGSGFACDRGNVLAGTIASQTPRINWEHLQGVRAEVLAKPTDRLTISALAIYQKINMGGYDEYDAPPGLPGYHFQPNNAQEPISDTFQLYGLTATYDLGFADLTSATAYYTRAESQTQDTAEALYSLLPLYGYSTTQYYTSPFNETDTTHQFSQELRLVSKGAGPLRWTVGAFYSHFESIFAESNNLPQFVSTIPGGLASNPDGVLYQANNPYRIKQYGLFGEGTYNFGGGWKLTAGARWYKFESTANEETTGLLAVSGNATPFLSTFSTSNSGVNPKVTLSYEHAHDLTVYATASKGFRPGGINQQIPNPPCTLNGETYGPDSIWNYEVGEKAKLFGNRVTVNADVYYINWSNVQQSVNQACGYPLTANAGSAEAYGPEVEISAQITHNLVFSFSGTYTHSAIKTADPALQAQDPLVVPGLPLLNVPKFTESTALTYTAPVNATWNLMARVSNSYVGKTTDIDYTYGTLPAYDIVSARLALMNGKITAALFADNLTNTHAQLGINTTGFSYTIPSLIRVATNQPRTFGVNVKIAY